MTPPAYAAVAAPSSEQDVDRVAAAVAACPGVAALSGGTLAEIGTYLPGRRVLGVRIERAGETPSAVEVHVVGRWPVTVADLADQVRAAVRTVAGRVPVAVFVDDLEVPGSDVPPTAGAT